MTRFAEDVPTEEIKRRIKSLEIAVMEYKRLKKELKYRKSLVI